MRRVFIMLLALMPSMIFALGDICHNYVAMQAQLQVDGQSPQLQQLLQDNRNAYLVGSDYPDTGFVPGHGFGEIAHWPNFVDPFIAHIRTVYAHPKNDAERRHRDQLTAFVMGIGTHIKSDIVSHWTYYEWVARKDFHATGADARVGGHTYEKAHSLMDPGSDAYITVRKGLLNHPTTWWVPLKDLVAVYQAMGHKDITEKLLLESNAEYYVITGLDEDLIAYPEYLYNALYGAPWGMANFENPDPQYGALPEMIKQSSDYALDIGRRILSPEKEQSMVLVPQLEMSPIHHNPVKQATLNLVDHAIKVGWLTVTPSFDEFGDATFTPKSVKFNSKLAKAQFNAALADLVRRLLDQLKAKHLHGFH